MFNNIFGGFGFLNVCFDYLIFLGGYDDEVFREWFKGFKDRNGVFFMISKGELFMFDFFSCGNVFYGDEFFGFGMLIFLEGVLVVCIVI